MPMLDYILDFMITTKLNYEIHIRFDIRNGSTLVRLKKTITNLKVVYVCLYLYIYLIVYCLVQ